MDLTKIDKPFGELDDETAVALLLFARRGGKTQMNDGDGWYDIDGAPNWHKGLIYRAAPQPVTPDSIDWSHVADGLNCMMRDGTGEAFLFSEPPVAQLNGGLRGEGWAPAKAFASYRRGTCDWQDSLVTRPGVEDAQ